MEPTMQTCSNLKSSLLSFLAEGVRVIERPEGCVIVLPLETVDQRKVTVMVESLGDTFVVHDGGKTMAELFCQGVSMTDKRIAHQSEIAHSHGVHIRNKMIRGVCKQSGLEQTILAVAQCSSMSMVDIVSRKPKFEEDRVPAKVLGILASWKPEWVSLKKDVDVKTDDSDHKLNAVCSGRDIVVGVKVLGDDNPKGISQRYGFLGIDLDRSDAYSDWLRLAVISGSNNWNDKALKLVRRYSTNTIEVRDKNEDEALGLLPNIMDDLFRPKASSLMFN
jgi:hypothetical protein